MTEEFKENVPTLYNTREPRDKRKTERARDRVILYMKAKGMTNRAIAEALGVGEQCVSVVTRQPWFQDNLVKLIHARGVEDIDKLLKIYEKDAALVAHDILMNSKSESLRAKAAFEFLRLTQGSKVRVVSEPKSVSEIDDEINRLQTELDELQHNRSRN